MSIEGFLAEQNKNKPRQFKDVVGKLLSEKEQEDTRPWKWEEEFTDEMLTTLLQEAEDGKEDECWFIYRDVLYIIRLLNPSHTPPIDELVWNKLEYRLLIEYQEKKWQRYFELASRMHILDPKRTLIIKPDAWEGIEDEIRHFEEIDTFVKIGVCVRILNPSYVLPNYEKEITDELENSKFERFVTTRFAAHARLIYPHISFNIPQDKWDRMKKELENKREEGVYEASLMIHRMRILAAYKVEVTNGGILITDKPPKNLDIIPPPRPIRKKI